MLIFIFPVLMLHKKECLPIIHNKLFWSICFIIYNLIIRCIKYVIHYILKFIKMLAKHFFVFFNKSIFV